MSPARVIIAIILISVGVFFSIVSVLGTFRFKFVLNRMHSAAMGDTLALLFVLLGLTVISGLTFTSLKLAVIIVFFWIASPVSSHLISNMIVTVDRKKVDDMCELIEADKKEIKTKQNRRKNQNEKDQ